jgi:maleylacetate reductase
MGDRREFTSTVNPARIVFGAGSLDRVAEEVRGRGASRALILTTPFQRAEGEALALTIGEQLAAGVFSQAVMQTPVSVTEQAIAAYDMHQAACVVAFGGGTTIGLGKAIAYRTNCPQVVVATTYAGSEVTPILGQTEDGMKTTLRHPRVLPEAVIYDPNLTLGLPIAISVTSGLNAMAHAIERLYAKDRNPVSSITAVEGLQALHGALPIIVVSPHDLSARSNALYGSWLSGTVLGSVGMAVHHKLCHTLGGAFDRPHSETQAIILPHSVAFNAAAAETELRPLAGLFGTDLGGGLWDFSLSLGAPMALKQLGLAEKDLGRATDLVVQDPYWNPRPVTRPAIRELLQHAYDGVRPTP